MRENVRFCEKQTFVIILAICMLLAFILVQCTINGTISAKTITNKDINEMKKKYERENAKKQPSSSSSSSKSYAKHPSVPPVTGVPSVPPPGGGNSSSGSAMVVKKHLPYEQWENEYKEYFGEYYQDSNLGLKPRMIVLHYSGTQNFATLWHTFINGGNYEGKTGHLSVHYAIDKDGTIYELTPPNRRARGTYGVNHVAISIDLVGRNENEILGNKKQMRVSFSLVKWLMKKYRIPKEKVLGHSEIAKGKQLVSEYTDFVDKQYPDRYPPGSKTRGPGKTFMFKLRYFLVEPR